jgi:predicted nucleotidyltransferase
VRFGLSDNTIEKLLRQFSKHAWIDRAIIYGSRAKGTHREGSDIDLTLESAQSDLHRLFELEREIDDLLLPYKVDLSYYNTIENEELQEYIKRVGEVFYDKDCKGGESKS